jgi:hypothetical protein
VADQTKETVVIKYTALISVLFLLGVLLWQHDWSGAITLIVCFAGGYAVARLA